MFYTSWTSGVFVIINCFCNTFTSYLKTRSLENHAMSIKIGTVRTESRDNQCVSLSTTYTWTHTHTAHTTLAQTTHTCMHMHTYTHAHKPPYTYTHTHTGTLMHVYSHTCTHTHTLFFSVPLLRPFFAGPPRQTQPRAAHLSQGPPTLKAVQTAFSWKPEPNGLANIHSAWCASLQSCYWSLNLLYRPMPTKEQNPILCYNYQPISFFIILF